MAAHSRGPFVSFGIADWSKISGLYRAGAESASRKLAGPAAYAATRAPDPGRHSRQAR